MSFVLLPVVDFTTMPDPYRRNFMSDFDVTNDGYYSFLFDDPSSLLDKETHHAVAEWLVSEGIDRDEFPEVLIFVAW